MDVWVVKWKEQCGKENKDRFAIFDNRNAAYECYKDYKRIDKETKIIYSRIYNDYY